MAILKIARVGHPVLRQKARRVEPTEIRQPGFQRLVDDMIDTMNEYHGIGLAAPQIHESVRLIVVGLHEDADDEDADIRIVPLVNPEIEFLTKDTEEDWEGCLSVPDMRGRVWRPMAIRVRAHDRRGKPLKMDLRGYPARVIQHEADHLDGVLYIDRMRSLETLTYLDEFARYWNKH
jgi:peptide deformylase